MKKKLIIAASIVLAVIILVFLIFAMLKGKSNKNLPSDKFNDISLLESQADIDEAIKVYKNLSEDKKNEEDMPEILYNLGILYEKKSKFDEAKKYYQKILSDYFGSVRQKDAQDKLGNLNIKILFSPEITPDSKAYEVAPGDTLGKIAKQFGTTVDLIRKSNNLSGDHIRSKMKIKVSTAKFSIIVDKSQNILTLKSNEEIFKVYPVATGLDNCTPVGTFTIVNKIVDPVWYTEDAMVPSGSPKNILGTRWIGLSIQHYGIHGSTDPSGIGKQVTAGCVRMHNKDVEELYTIVPTNTEVVIVD